MPTRVNPRLVARAIRGFQLPQGWPERELVIVACEQSPQLQALETGDPEKETASPRRQRSPQDDCK
jgi:hypothetical protein